MKCIQKKYVINRKYFKIEYSYYVNELNLVLVYTVSKGTQNELVTFLKNVFLWLM